MSAARRGSATLFYLVEEPLYQAAGAVEGIRRGVAFGSAQLPCCGWLKKARPMTGA
jgi:hypothetical protein